MPSDGDAEMGTHDFGATKSIDARICTQSIAGERAIHAAALSGYSLGRVSDSTGRFG